VEVFAGQAKQAEDESEEVEVPPELDLYVPTGQAVIYSPPPGGWYAK